MGARSQLAEDVVREDREERSRLRSLETKLRELRDHRQDFLDQVHQLSDEQKTLYDRKGPLQAELEAFHSSHKLLGRQIAELRPQREKARQRVDAAVVALRLARNEVGREERIRPDQLRREIAQLELKHQTTALPLSDENELVDRLRELGRKLKDAEKNHAIVLEREEKRRALEEEFRRCRAEVDRLGVLSVTLRKQRDATMESMQLQLVQIGQLVGGMRSRAQQRGEVMERIDTLSRQIRDLEREALRILAHARARRQEARRTMARYTSGGRRPQATMADAAADAQLEELLKRGRVTLGG